MNRIMGRQWLERSNDSQGRFAIRMDKSPMVNGPGPPERIGSHPP
jgi:hypothetical protein